MFHNLHCKISKPKRLNSGFTLIELMIVVAIIAIILTLALPVYTNYSIRAKIGEGLALAAAAKTTVAATCIESPLLTDLNNNKVGYVSSESEWVESITASASCTQPVITIVTKNTGAPSPPPEFTLTGTIGSSTSSVTWVCASTNTPNHLLPAACRST
jgi:type IV pilus assembly protein PilA